MGYKFTVYQDKKGEYRWNLKAGNGEIVADSGEGYTTKANALNGISLVQTNAPTAEIVEVAY